VKFFVDTLFQISIIADQVNILNFDIFNVCAYNKSFSHDPGIEDNSSQILQYLTRKLINSIYIQMFKLFQKSLKIHKE